MASKSDGSKTSLGTGLKTNYWETTSASETTDTDEDTGSTFGTMTDNKDSISSDLSSEQSVQSLSDNDELKLPDPVAPIPDPDATDRIMLTSLDDNERKVCLHVSKRYPVKTSCFCFVSHSVHQTRSQVAHCRQSLMSLFLKYFFFCNLELSINPTPSVGSESTQKGHSVAA